MNIQKSKLRKLSIFTISMLLFVMLNVALVSPTGSGTNPIALKQGAITATSINATQYYIGPQNLTDFLTASNQPAIQASYVITGDSTGMYYMKNGTTSKIDEQSTNASKVINDARGNLTLNRNWKEMIALHGNITITSPILFDNYTEFNLYGATVNLGADCNAFQSINNDTVICTSIYGGQINGYNHTGTGIYYVSTAEPTISWRNSFYDLNIFDCNGTGGGIYLYGPGGRSVVSNVFIYNCRYGMWINSPDSYVLNTIAGNSAEYAFYVSGGSTTLTACKGYGSGYHVTNHGYGLQVSGHDMQFIGCTFQENQADGVYVDTASYSITLTGCTYDRNGLSINDTFSGIRIGGSNVTITGGHFINMAGRDPVQRYGVYVKSTANQVIVLGVGYDHLLDSWYYVEAGATNINMNNGNYDEVWWTGGTNSSPLNDTAMYCQISGLGSPVTSSSEQARRTVIPAKGHLTAFLGVLNTALTVGNFSLIVRVNGANTTLTILFTNVTSNISDISTAGIAVNQYDLVSIGIFPIGTPSNSSRYFSLSLHFLADG